MTKEIDWRLTTWQGLRRQQQIEFAALPFREKIRLIEQMGEVVAYFDAERMRRLAVHERPREDENRD